MNISKIENSKSIISIIIPLYNEEQCVIELIKKLNDLNNNKKYVFEFLIIDDGSVDKTNTVLQENINSLPNSKIITFTKNFGQTAALSAGINNSNGETIVTMDGDLQNDISDIPVLIENLNKGYDTVCGWRKNRLDGYISRVFPSKIANWIISKISGVYLHDYGCTLKAYKRSILENVKLYGEMHRFIPIYVAWQGGKILEIPVKHNKRQLGKSKYGILRSFSVIADLIFLKFMEKQFSNPIHIFGGFGVVNFILSISSFLLMVYYKYFGNKSFIETPLPELTILFFLIGTLSIFIGLIAEIIIRTYFESQNVLPYVIKKSQEKLKMKI
tara:strand:+ start:3811 stop:4797 length:987 start_codon:yes stop_codon:yes gene_type:complete